MFQGYQVYIEAGIIKTAFCSIQNAGRAALIFKEVTYAIVIVVFAAYTIYIFGWFDAEGICNACQHQY